MKVLSSSLLIGFCALAAHSASLQGLGALGEDMLPGDAALAGRGYAGSATVTEGFSVVNPARMAFDTKTRFFASLDYQGVYATEAGQSIGRDRFDITSIGLSIPMGSFGALGVGLWQHFGETFSAVHIQGVDTGSISYAGSLREIVPAYAIRLPAEARHFSVGLAWHMPLGSGTYIMKEHIDTTSLDATGLPMLRNVTVDERLYSEWSCNNVGYPAFALQYHQRKVDYFVSGSMAYTLKRTLKNEMQLSDYDTTATSTSAQKIRMPWQWATGFSLQPWESQTISVEFQSSSAAESSGPLLSWAGVPTVASDSTFSRTSNERMIAIGWQKDGSGIFFDPFVKRNTFRAGVWARNWYLSGMNEYAGALGYGMPLGKRGAKLDFALYAGIREFDEPIQGHETFWGIKAGFTGIGAWGESSRHRN